MLVTEARNATLEDLVQILQAQQAAKLDLVVSAGRLRFERGNLKLEGWETQLTEDGFYDPNGIYRPTPVFDGHLADRLDIPVRYVRKMRAERPDIFDDTMNAWFGGRRPKLTLAGMHAVRAGEELLPEHIVRPEVAPDSRNLLARLFLDAEAGTGVARALLSDRYATMDNLDGVMAMLAGIKSSGVEGVQVEQCDLTDKRVYVRVTAPGIQTTAHELLRGYRNPFANPDIERFRGLARREGMAYTEAEGGDPIVFAGFVFSNSEVGEGRWQLSPQIVIQVCKNGLTVTEDIFGKTHLGARLDEGRVQWSAETQNLNIQLVTAQTTDVVRKFMSLDWLQSQVDKIEELAGAKLAKPADTIKVVGKKMGFTEEAIAGILSHFVVGGQATVAGVINAVTSYTQTIPDADQAFEMERRALEAGQLAAAVRV